jgi:hypothetical protein
MFMDQNRRDKELDTDEEQEKGPDVIANVLGKIESSC